MDGMQPVTVLCRTKNRHLGKWCGISLVLHLTAFILTALYSAGPARKVAPIIIDLTFDAVPAAEKTAPALSPSASAHTSPLPVQGPVDAPVARPVQAEPSPAALPAAAAPVAAAVTAARDRSPQPVSGVNTAAAPAGRTANQQRSGPVEQKGDGDGAKSPEKARNRYLKEHFAYIRDLVVKKLVYPHQAKKMGWNGKVTVSFVVCEDGTAREIKVVESSGYPILDRCAVDTVRSVSPFPKPPLQAEIVIPVQFRLM